MDESSEKSSPERSVEGSNSFLELGGFDDGEKFGFGGFGGSGGGEVGGEVREERRSEGGRGEDGCEEFGS